MIKNLFKWLVCGLCIAALLVIGYSIIPLSYVDSVSKSTALSGNDFKTLDDLQKSNALNLEIEVFDLLKIWAKNNGCKPMKTNKGCLAVATERVENLNEGKTDFKAIKNFKSAYSVSGKYGSNAYQIVNHILTYTNVTEMMKNADNIAIGIKIIPNFEKAGRFKYCVIIGEC